MENKCSGLNSRNTGKWWLNNNDNIELTYCDYCKKQTLNIPDQLTKHDRYKTCKRKF